MKYILEESDFYADFIKMKEDLEDVEEFFEEFDNGMYNILRAEREKVKIV